MINISVFMKNVVSMTNPIGTKLRDAAMKGILATPYVRDYAQKGEWKPKPIYTKNQYLGMPRPRRTSPEGALAPQPDVRLITGKRLRLDEVLGKHFSIVGLNCDPRDNLSAENIRLLAQLDTKFVTVFGYGQRPQNLAKTPRNVSENLMEIEDLTGELGAWFAKAGFDKTAIAVLRPDKFVFSLALPNQINAVLLALQTQLGG